MSKRKLNKPSKSASEKSSQRSDELMGLAKIYIRHILITLLISLGIWVFAVFSPNLGIKVPLLFFMPTLYTIVLAFIRHPSGDYSRGLSLSVFIGFIFLILITAIAPLVYQIANPAAG